jgi:hypothetical protein
MEPLMLDLITLIILAVSALICYRRGFAASVVRLVGWLLAFAAASALSRPVAQWAYGRFFAQRILASVETQVRAFVSPEELVNNLEALIAQLPAGVGAILRIDGQTVGDWMLSLVEQVPFSELSAAITDRTVAPIIIAMLGMLVFFGLFMLLGALVRFVASALRLVNRLPVVGRLNALLGAGVGLVQGGLFVLVLAMGLRLGVLATQDGLHFITHDQISTTYLFHYFYPAGDQMPFSIDFR